MIHKDTRDSEELLFLWPPLITLNDYRWASSGEKACGAKSRRNQGPASGCPIPRELHPDAPNSPGSDEWQQEPSSADEISEVWCPRGLLWLNRIGMEPPHDRR